MFDVELFNYALRIDTSQVDEMPTPRSTCDLRQEHYMINFFPFSYLENFKEIQHFCHIDGCRKIKHILNTPCLGALFCSQDEQLPVRVSFFFKEAKLSFKLREKWQLVEVTSWGKNDSECLCKIFGLNLRSLSITFFDFLTQWYQSGTIITRKIRDTLLWEMGWVQTSINDVIQFTFDWLIQFLAFWRSFQHFRTDPALNKLSLNPVPPHLIMKHNFPRLMKSHSLCVF